MTITTLAKSIRAVLIGVAAVASAAWAQEPQPATNPAAEQQPAETRDAVPAEAPTSSGATTSTATIAIDEQKMNQFADAYVAVQEIQANAAPELDKNADNPAAQQATQAKAESEMVAAVERSGLKIEEFNGIVESMTADADLRARIAAKVRERMKG